MPTSSSVDHVLMAMKAQVYAIHAHAAGARNGQDPEDVHQMRVAIRRLRAILRAGCALFSPKWVEGLRGELEWLATPLGRVRDLDVLHAYLRAWLKARPAAERTAGQRLLRHLDVDRARANARLRSALAGPRYARILARLKAALIHPAIRNADVSLPGIAAVEFEKLRKSVKKLPKRPSADDLHAVRIKVKRARYATELAQPMVARPGERFIKTAKTLQDILGEHQDAVVVEAYLRRAKDKTQAAQTLAQQLSKQQGKRRDQALVAFTEQWPKIKRRGRRAFDTVTAP